MRSSHWTAVAGGLAVAACVDLDRPPLVVPPALDGPPPTSRDANADTTADAGTDVPRDTTPPDVAKPDAAKIDTGCAGPNGCAPGFACLAGGCTSLAAGLVAHWRFDEGRGTSTADASGTGLVGTLKNGPGWTGAGFPGARFSNPNALSLDGIDDYVEVPAHAHLGITGDITISAWVKRSALLDYGAIVSKEDQGSWDYDFYFDNDTDELRFYSSNATPKEILSKGKITDTSGWHHVAATRSGSTLAFYIDGAPAGSSTMTGQFGNAPVGPTLGSEGTAPHAFFSGSLDDVRIYNRALSADEMAALGVGQ